MKIFLTLLSLLYFHLAYTQDVNKARGRNGQFIAPQDDIVKSDTIEMKGNAFQLIHEGDKGFDYGKQAIADGEEILKSYNEFLSNEDYMSAKKNFERAIQLGITDDNLLYFDLGFCEYHLAEHADAIKDLTSCLYYLGNAKLFFRYEGYTKIANGYGEMISSEIIKVLPADAYDMRGYCKLMLEDNRGAINDFTKAIQLRPTWWDYGNRGTARLNLGLYLDAKADFTKVIELHPQDEKAYFNRGLCNHYLNLKSQACSDLSRAGELGMKEAYEAIKEFCN